METLIVRIAQSRPFTLMQVCLQHVYRGLLDDQ